MIEFDVAVQAVREAAALCRGVQTRIAVEKKDKSPVTIADFGSQALICRALSTAFPHDPIIAEEESSQLGDLAPQVAKLIPGASVQDVRRWIDANRASAYSDRFWTLDPIDGTKGFLRGGQYAIALALVVRGQVEVAALACPNLPAIFAAVRGQGTIQADAGPVRVSGVSHPAQARFCESVESGHSSHAESERVAARLGFVRPPLRMDSQAKYGVVARGDAEIYMRFPTRDDYRENIWDHAAGALVITEAGGKVTDLSGKPLDFARGARLEDNRGIIATNGLLHEAVLGAI